MAARMVLLVAFEQTGDIAATFGAAASRSARGVQNRTILRKLTLLAQHEGTLGFAPPEVYAFLGRSEFGLTAFSDGSAAGHFLWGLARRVYAGGGLFALPPRGAEVVLEFQKPQAQGL